MILSIPLTYRAKILRKGHRNPAVEEFVDIVPVDVREASRDDVPVAARRVRSDTDVKEWRFLDGAFLADFGPADDARKALLRHSWWSGSVSAHATRSFAPDDLDAKSVEWSNAVGAADELRRFLAKAVVVDGSLWLPVPEPRYVVDVRGYAVRIVPRFADNPHPKEDFVHPRDVGRLREVRPDLFVGARRTGGVETDMEFLIPEAFSDAPNVAAVAGILDDLILYLRDRVGKQARYDLRPTVARLENALTRISEMDVDTMAGQVETMLAVLGELKSSDYPLVPRKLTHLVKGAGARVDSMDRTDDLAVLMTM